MSAERDKFDERSQQFPCECPSCRRQSGVPKSAATIPGEPFKVRLSIHCPLCQHNWTGAAGPATERGLFGTPRDAVMVLYAELLSRATSRSTGELVGDR